MELAVFVVVVLARFVVPLAIPKYPLPAIVLALVIDADRVVRTRPSQLLIEL